MALALMSLLAHPCAAQVAPALDPVAVRAALVARVNDGTFRGVAAGWAERDAVSTVIAGVTRQHGAAIDTQARFEIGEIAELFTIALLAKLVVRGDMSLDDLAQKFLPTDIRLPHRLGRAITLGDLAFHRAGLPDVRSSGAGSPAERVARGIRGATLRYDIGSRFAYSQLGIDILGLALARHLRMPLATAIQLRVLSPLSIPDFAPAFEPRLAARDATGHRPDGT
ncbi:MAG: beta-lactamase family protein, partial [Gemmatimonadaceae bacterium]|nr:beta-lactamase family protein [Gemmatimonadaceae bacterium]